MRPAHQSPPPSPKPFRITIKKYQYETLYKAINMLKPDYKKLICQYYGIKCDNMTLEQIANVNNVTRQAIDSKKNNALKELKRNYIKLGGTKIE